MKHTQTIEVHGPDEVPEAGRKFIIYGADNTIRELTLGGDASESWRLALGQIGAAITHWHYTDAIKTPPKPEPVTVRMRPGTERPGEKDWPVHCLWATDCGIAANASQLPVCVPYLWIPLSEAIPREPWRHEETLIGDLDSCGRVRNACDWQ